MTKLTFTPKMAPTRLPEDCIFKDRSILFDLGQFTHFGQEKGEKPPKKTRPEEKLTQPSF